MAIYSSILAWDIPWTEKPDGLQSMGSQNQTYLSDSFFHWVAQMVESACNAGDLGSIPGWGIFPREGNGNPLQYSCLENPMDGGA